jgi:hypothetical protein
MVSRFALRKSRLQTRDAAIPYTSRPEETCHSGYRSPIAAALCQNIRTTMQQKIRGILSVDGANFVRYLYGAPLALGMLAFLVFGTGRQVRTSRWPSSAW